MLLKNCYVIRTLFTLEFIIIYLLCNVKNANANQQELQVLQNIIGDLTKNIKELKEPEVVAVDVDQDKQDNYEDSEHEHRVEDSGPSTYWLDYLLKAGPDLRSQSEHDLFLEIEVTKGLKSALRGRCNSLSKCQQICPAKSRPKKKKQCKQTCQLVFDVTAVCEQKQQWGKTLPPHR